MRFEYETLLEMHILLYQQHFFDALKLELIMTSGCQDGIEQLTGRLIF